MPQQVKKSLVISICFILAVSTLLVFWQVRNFDFINYDDNDYVSANPNVLNGLTAGAVWWAFTTGHAANWHPLTWLSLMLDRQFFGPNPAGFHLTNLFFHIANTLLLFFVLKQMTNALWQSAFVAALFALHPLHVESVAWIAERKDVLSTFFWILTMWTYLRYVKQPNVFRYLLALLIFALGLMAKPMLVTLPFVFLLLDYWPFQRKISWRPLVEKVPFIVLSIVSSAIAFLAQQSSNSISSFTALPLKFRVANALISYMKYIEKLFLPSRLSAFYPHPFENVSVLYAVISAAALLAVTILVIRLAQNHRYFVTGWFWYLGTLVPVIGIIQVGSHAMADRYTYITLTGLFIIIAWGLSELLAKSPQRKIVIGLSMVIVLTTLGICASRQVSYWKNSITLSSHALAVTQNNWLAHYDIGNAYARLGRWTEAIDAYRQTIKIRPNYADAHYNLGLAYGSLSRWPEAIDAYQQAIKIKPDCVEAYNNLGVVYEKLGRWSEAIDAHKQTIKIDPNNAQAYNNLGVVYVNLSRYNEAIETFTQAVRIKPDYAVAHKNLGVAYLAIGDKNSAMAEYNILMSLNPQSANNLLKEINK
jgi:Flp pilus assembly protein TadD